MTKGTSDDAKLFSAGLLGTLVLSGVLGLSIFPNAAFRALYNGVDMHVSEQAGSHEQEEHEFLSRFRSLSPQERVQVWKDSNTLRHQHGVARKYEVQMQDLLIAEGTDTAPYLATILRDENAPYFYRFWSIRILSDMDRYVPSDDMPVAARTTIYVKGIVSGAVNPFLEITRRRIGAEGVEALRWAADHAKDQEIRSHAQNALGEIGANFGALTLHEVVQQWRATTAQSKGIESDGLPALPSIESFKLGQVLVERAPDSLPEITEALRNDQNPYVLEYAIFLVKQIDLRRVRLRTIPEGRDAVESAHLVLLHKKLRGDLGTAGERSFKWQTLADQVYNDNFGLAPATEGAFYAHMLHLLYGEDAVITHAGDRMHQAAVPAIRAFFTYLTNKDAYFPSWEYTYTLSDPSLQAFLPKFRQKMDRVDAAWKEFQNGNPSKP